MSKKLKGLGGLLVVIVLALLALPWIDGYLFKQQYFNYLKMLAANQFKVSVVEYHQGWLNSEAKIAIQELLPNSSGLPAPPNTPVNIAAGPPQTVILDQKITHGPLVRNPITKQWILAQAVVDSHLHLPPDIEAVLLGNQASQGMMELTLIATFDGQFINQFKTPVISKSIPSLGNFTWQGLNGTARVLMSGSALNRVLVHMTIGGIAVQSTQGNLNTQDATFQYDMTPDVSGLWNGSYHFLAPQVIFTSPMGSFNLANLQLVDSFNVTNNNYSNSFQLMLGQMAIPDYTFTQSNVTLSLNNLSATGLVNLIKAAAQMQQAPGAHITDQQYEKYGPYLPALWTPTTTLSYNSTINSSYGHLITDGLIHWPMGVKQQEDFSKNANGILNLRISIAFVKKIMETINAKAQQEMNAAHAGTPQVPAQPSVTQPAPAQPSPAEQMQQQLDGFVKQGYLIVDKDDYVTAISYEQGVLKANGHVVQ